MPRGAGERWWRRSQRQAASLAGTARQRVTHPNSHVRNGKGDLCRGLPVAFSGCQGGVSKAPHPRERAWFSHTMEGERCSMKELPGGSDDPLNPRCCS